MREDVKTMDKLAKNKQKPITPGIFSLELKYWQGKINPAKNLEMGKTLGRKIGAFKYVECSALTQVNESFDYDVTLSF